MRAVVLTICLLSAVVVGAAYHYRDAWYGGSWLESWVERDPTPLASAERAGHEEATATPEVAMSSPASSLDTRLQTPSRSADSISERVESILGESEVMFGANEPGGETRLRPEQPTPLGTKVTEAIRAGAQQGTTGQGPDVAGDPVMEAVANVVGDAVEAALADTVSKEETPAVAEAVASAVAEAISTTGPEASAQDVADAVARAVETVVVEEQAKSYVERITEPDADPVAVEHADHFVTQDQVISLLPEASFEVTTRDALTEDPDLDLNTPITLVHEVEQVEMTTPEKIIANAAAGPDRPVRLLIDDEIEELTVQQVIERYGGDPGQPIAMVKIARHYEMTTPGELAADPSLAPDEPLTIVKRPYRLESATVAELLRLKLESNPDTVFYIRTVEERDAQGIWGIVFDSLVENFARGMSIRHGERVQTYRIQIPRDADELLADRSSSFLGSMIHTKTIESHVYNFREHRMGRNPDRIYPGQEIVIIDFQPEELIGIYKHFLAIQG